MEGLEISEVMLSKLEFSGRLDSEYYQKSFLKYEELILSKKGVILDEFSDFLIGPFGSAFTVDNYTEKTTYRYIRGKDVKPLRLMDDDNVYMPESHFKRLKKYSLKENDILVSVVGTLGNAALVTKNDLPAIFSCKSTVLRTKNVIPAYLLVYINSKYGNNLLMRKERGAIQKGLNLDDLKQFLIFNPSIEFQKQIESLFFKSLECVDKSKLLYHQAEQLLLKEIGLEDFKPSEEGINIKSFQDSFISSGRLDAEYYQPKYDDFIELIENYKNGFGSLRKICDLKDNNYSPKSEKEYKYVELSNIGKTGDIIGATLDLGKNLPSRARRILKNRDVIISSIEGSLQSCALVNREYENALCSTGFYVINSHKINSETLIVLFKSEVMQQILKQKCSGTILTAINKSEFLDISIPLITHEIQTQIATLVEESFSLKSKSEKLLSLAKEAVEMAIEQSEEIALSFIEQETNLLAV